MEELRLGQVQKVLALTLVLNLSVCVIKIALGFSSGILAIAADGFHSLGDTLSNVGGLIGVRWAKKKPDQKHGYGYDRFENVTALLVMAIIFITCYKVFEEGVTRLLEPKPIEISQLVLWLMFGSILINVITVVYESRAGKRLGSNLLIADSNETKTDIWVSFGVIASAILAQVTGWYALDGLITVMIGFLILKMIIENVGPIADQLADAQVVPPEQIKEVIMSIPEVKFCHAIRSRGQEMSFFLDCHIGIDPVTTVDVAHDQVCHKVKLALRLAFPGLRSANVQIEPANEAGFRRENSVFRDLDPYDYLDNPELTA